MVPSVCLKMMLTFLYCTCEGPPPRHPQLKEFWGRVALNTAYDIMALELLIEISIEPKKNISVWTQALIKRSTAKCVGCLHARASACDSLF